MIEVPERPKIYHITPLNNLIDIVQSGFIWSDAIRVSKALNCTIIGMNQIKKRRLEQLEVSCHPNTRVGEYVPFYFCPRSIMLYILYKGNHPELTYRSGQGDIVHLQADFYETIKWANASNALWAFTDSNAGARYSRFFKNIAELKQIDWEAVKANDFRDAKIKDGKQAEFLVFESFPWHLVELIGVKDSNMANGVKTAIGPNYQQLVSVESTWYF